MQLVRSWSSLVVFFLFCFSLFCADSPWFSFFSLSSFFRLISRIGGVVVWCGWMTSLLCLFRIVWRQGTGHSWRTQGGDRSQGSKVSGKQAGRNWLLYYAYHKLLPLSGGCFMVWFARYFPFFFVIFPLVLSLTPFTSRGVFVLFLFFFSSSLFSNVCHIACRGGARQVISSIFSI